MIRNSEQIEKDLLETWGVRTKRYKNLKFGNEAIFIIEMENMVEVKYVDTKVNAWYKLSYFDKYFNPITE